MKIGLKYYSLKLGEGATVDISFENVKADINKNLFLTEFEAIYSVFVTAAYNPYNEDTYKDKNLKIAEIIANWGITNENIQKEQKRACEFVFLNKGKIDFEKVFSFIDIEKHNSIALLACDIAMYGINVEDYQERFLHNISSLVPSVKPIISQSISYFENRRNASNIKWSFQNGEHIAAT